MTKILCIDDDEFFGLLVQRIFSNINSSHEVIVKPSAVTGLHYLKSLGDFNFPRIILLDINMPNKNGFQFIEEYKKLGFNNYPTSFFLVSSTIFPEDERKALAEPLVKKVFTKPFLNESAQIVLKEAYLLSQCQKVDMILVILMISF